MTRILIVDDNALVRKSCRALFCYSEIRVVAEASNGDEALQLVRAGSFDLVLLDIQMPDSDGFVALRQIKSERPELPILMHSAVDEPDYVARSRELGADGYVVKGTDVRHLIEMIRVTATGKCLRNRRFTGPIR